MGKSKGNRPTYTQFIKFLRRYGVEAEDWKIHYPGGKTHALKILKRKTFTKTLIYPVEYQPREKISQYIIRSICHNLEIDSTEIEFELLD